MRSWRGSSCGLTATLDAFCGGRIFGRFEGFVQGVNGLALKAESDVSVDAGRVAAISGMA